MFNNKIKEKKMEKELVFRNDSGVAVTSSLLVAETFGKKHKHVVRDIDDLFSKMQNIENQCSPNLDYAKPMFESYYVDVLQPNGGIKPAKRYLMNKDGFTLLVMGYTGQKAMEFKLKYINAFNKMEAQLKQGYQLQSEFTQAQMQLMQMMTDACNNLIQSIKSFEKHQNSRHCKIEEEPRFPEYMTVREVAEAITRLGHNINEKQLFSFLRYMEYIGSSRSDYNKPKQGYLDTGKMRLEYPEFNSQNPDNERKTFVLMIAGYMVKELKGDLDFMHGMDYGDYLTALNG